MDPVVETLMRRSLAPHQRAKTGKPVDILEYIAFIVRGRVSSNPTCVCPVLSKIAVQFNYKFSHPSAPVLADNLLRLAGSKGTPAHAAARAYVLMDCLVREYLPRLLAHPTFAQLPATDELARTIAALPEIAGPADLPGVAAVFSAVRISKRVDNLSRRTLRALTHLKEGALAEAVYAAVDVIDTAELLVQMSGLGPPGNGIRLQDHHPWTGVPFDVAGLFERLLAIGDVQPIPTTPAMEARLQKLSGRGRPTFS